MRQIHTPIIREIGVECRGRPDPKFACSRDERLQVRVMIIQFHRRSTDWNPCFKDERGVVENFQRVANIVTRAKLDLTRTPAMVASAVERVGRERNETALKFEMIC